MKRNLVFTFLLLLLLTFAIACKSEIPEEPEPQNPDPAVSYTITYTDGSGKDVVVTVKSTTGYVLPNSLLELGELPKDTEILCTNFSLQDYSFYGWQDESGAIYQYSKNPENNPSAKIKLSKNTKLSALWVNIFNGEIIGVTEYCRLKGLTQEAKEQITDVLVPRVYSKWDGNTHKDYLVTEIADDAFKDNTTIKTVVLPDSISKIGEGAFSGCSSVEKIEFRSQSAPTLGTGALSTGNANLKVYVPQNVSTDYKTSWAELAEKIQSIEEDQVKHVISISLNKTELTLDCAAAETLICTVLPTDAVNKDIFWTSDTPTVATVDANGKVEAVAAGTAIITATSKDLAKTAQCNVTVNEVIDYLTFSSDSSFSVSPYYEEGSNVYAFWGEYVGGEGMENLVHGKLEFSTDATTWTEFSTTAKTIATSAIDGTKYKLYIRGKDNKSISYCYGEMPWTVVASGNVECVGNIMTLLDHENPDDATMSKGCFAGLFLNCSSLTVAPDLPATVLPVACYSSMFNGCTSLTTAPTISATSLAKSCCSGMFSGCTSLVNAPSLPATTLAEKCYEEMFSGCTSLVNAPALSATTLAEKCYEEMFSGCTSLVSAPALPATTLATCCYYSMFSGCTNLASAPVLSATTLTESCYDTMFDNCSALTEAPVLSATTLAKNCYSCMFRYCSGLTAAPALNAVNLAESCYSNMFAYCTNLVTPPNLPATTLAYGCYASMFGDCSSLKISSASGTSFFVCPADGYDSVSIGSMFKNTGGTFTGNPASGSTYYYY